jgi:hypothetical protein
VSLLIIVRRILLKKFEKISLYINTGFQIN